MKSRLPTSGAALRVLLQAVVFHSLFPAICSTFLSPFMRMRNLWIHCFKQPAQVGRRLKISIFPVDILLLPPSVLDKRHKLFLKKYGRFCSPEGHSSAQGLLMSGEATPLRHWSFCLPWRKLIPWDDGDAQPEHGPLSWRLSSIAVRSSWGSEAKQKEKAFCQSSGVWTHRALGDEELRSAEPLAQLLLLPRGSTNMFQLPPKPGLGVLALSPLSLPSLEYNWILSRTLSMGREICSLPPLP